MGPRGSRPYSWVSVSFPDSHRACERGTRGVRVFGVRKHSEYLTKIKAPSTLACSNVVGWSRWARHPRTRATHSSFIFNREHHYDRYCRPGIWPSYDVQFWARNSSLEQLSSFNLSPTPARSNKEIEFIPSFGDVRHTPTPTGEDYSLPVDLGSTHRRYIQTTMTTSCFMLR